MATFLERLKELQGEMTDAEFARRCGLKYTTMKNYLAGRSLPPLDVAAQIADTFGKSIDWLFGRDPVARAILENVTVEALRLVGEVVDRVHREERIRLPPSSVVPEISRHFDVLVEMIGDPRDLEEWRALMPWLANRVRKELANAAAAPGTGKREAS